MERILPAYPLFLKDPYFSFHLAGESLINDPVTFWSGQKKTFYGFIKIDGRIFNFLGNKAENSLVQTGLHISTFKTTFTFIYEEDIFKVEFTSPLPLDNLDILSLPLCYLSYEYSTTKNREIEVCFVVGEDLLYNEESKASLRGIKGSGFELKGYALSSFRTRRQNYLSHSDDEKLADHGTYYLSGEMSVFIDENGLKSYLSNNFNPTYDGDYKYLLATTKGAKGVLVLGRDEVLSLQYFDEIIIPYYKEKGMNIFDAFHYFYANYEGVEKDLHIFADKLVQAAAKISPSYLTIVNASYRQSIAAHKLGRNRKGELLFISKECSSNGCAATADVSYPSMPLFLLYNAELVNAMLRPIFKFSRYPIWNYDFAPHDAGRFPLLIGQVYALNNLFLYGGNDRGLLESENLYYTYPKGSAIYDMNWQMPIEESSNMIIMAYSAYRYTKDPAIINENYDLLLTWGKYLAKHGYIPEHQLCTDDFSGHLDKNVNLTIKATIGMKCFLEIAKIKQDKAAIAEFEPAIAKFVQLLEDVSRENGFLPLTFAERENRFSLKYNLAIDHLFNFNLFSKALYDRELTKYRANLEINGIRLDSRNAYAKADWQIWIASFADKKLANEIYDRIAYFLKTASSRWPFPDWFDADSPTVHMFRNRSVVGGNFMPLLLTKL